MLSRSVLSAATPSRTAVRPVATGARSFFAKASAMPQVAVDEEFPSVPATSPHKPTEAAVTTSVSASGLPLASSSGSPLVATLGVEIAAGTSVETDATAGLSQLYAQMAFRATTARSDLRLFRDIEALGGVIHKAAGRDFVRYNISVLPDRLEAAAEILAETTLAPRFAHWDIATQKKQVLIEHELLTSCSERSVMEGLHAAAFYDDVALGRPLVSVDNLSSFTADSLAAFHEQYTTTASLALVGAGMEHATLNSVANSLFAGVPAASTRVAKPAAQYIGGESRVKKLTAKNTYVALGFPTAGTSSSESLAAAQVLRALLTARLGNSKTASAFVTSYQDVSLLGMAGYASPDQAGALVDSFAAAIKKVASAAPSTEELAVAKTVAALEANQVLASRQGRVAQLGVLAFAQKPAVSPLAAVANVGAVDLQQLAQKALTARPSLASVGKLSTVPRLDALVSKLK